MTPRSAALAASLAWICITGCGSKPEPSATRESRDAQPVYFNVDPAHAGAVRGSARFAGQRPAPQRISMDAEEACEKLHPSPVFDERVRVAMSGGLANVFVYVKAGLEGKTFAPAEEAVVLEQRGCRFVPRVVALRVGQTLAVRNSDPVSHNIHPMPKNNRDWNQQQAPGAPDLRRRFGYPEVMIPVKCNVHAWMRSYVAVLEHPFFAITNDQGEFALPPLPPGHYTVAAWHEAFGEVEQRITVRPGEAQPLTFTFK